MKQPKFGPLFLAGGLFVIFMIAFMVYVNGYVQKITNIDSIAATFDSRKYDGLLLEKKALSTNKYLYLFDSSNLDHTDFYYHASNIFRGEEGFIPYLVGENSVTSIHHALKIVDLGNSIRNRKIVFLVEPLYYITKHAHSYRSTKDFSALHVYQFIFKSKIDQRLKAKIAKTLLKTREFEFDPILTGLLSNLSKKHPNKMIHILIEPLGHSILDVLEQIDRFNAYQLMLEHHPEPTGIIHKDSLDWQRLMLQAQKDGEKACRTNPFGIEDSSYNGHIKPELNSFRNQSKNEIYLDHNQLNELQLLLEVFKTYNLKPLIIIDPVNGFWSDYEGLSKKVRQQCYTQVKQIIHKAGFQYVDFSDHEYDKYFMRDTKHIGWKGWVYLDQAMDRFYHQ
ncbi:MAG TPA: D-alanyl-lipoteichoic acid biosynthesis protein DltD [Firmicutes bacterium]|jgi:D-alanine transfer protein|nr:D-alanyl-lipoteichoic acid biosynthesis protein DltD [Bacillota bacterium]